MYVSRFVRPCIQDGMIIGHFPSSQRRRFLDGYKRLLKNIFLYVDLHIICKPRNVKKLRAFDTLYNI